MRLGWTKQAVTELVGVTEHTMGLNRLAQGLMLKPDLERPRPEDDNALVALIGREPEDERLASLFADIESAEKKRLGIRYLPNVWRLMARKHDYLVTTWGKHQLLFGEGDLDLDTKLAVGLGVSMTNASIYFIQYFKRALEKLNYDDAAVFEIAIVVDLYNSYNKVADGHMIDSEEEIKEQLAY